MVLKALNKAKPARVLSLDCSTNSVGYALFEHSVLIGWGEINFTGKTVFQRLADGQKKFRAFQPYLRPDLVAIEGAVYIQNKKTVIQLAYTFGAIISAVSGPNTEVIEASPMTWQNFIGNKALTKVEKEVIKGATPGKTETWYKNANREFRKERTAQWVEDQFGRRIESDNITDAIGLGWYACSLT